MEKSMSIEIATQLEAALAERDALIEGSESVIFAPPEGSILHYTGWGKVTERSDFAPIFKKYDPIMVKLYVRNHTCSEKETHVDCLKFNNRMNDRLPLKYKPKGSESPPEHRKHILAAAS